MGVTSLLSQPNARLAVFQNTTAVCVDRDARQDFDEHRQPEKVMDMHLTLSASEFIFTTAPTRSKCYIHCFRVVSDPSLFDQSLVCMDEDSKNLLRLSRKE